MSRRTTLPITLFLLFAAVALPAPAAPGDFASDLFARAWGWLDRLWSPTANAAPAGRSEGRTPRGIWAENGVCIDPDGKTRAGCSAFIWAENGVCIDPNGRPGCAASSVQAENGSCIDPDGKAGAGCAR
ncbi:MAG TPA: hypothetical protein VGS22_23280 [Thermoanaerobaculia bacterium]|jgi:hypothetical protein|nr:hypothetical protein [Thermoanaerobaculia bacterium]